MRLTQTSSPKLVDLSISASMPKMEDAEFLQSRTAVDVQEAVPLMPLASSVCNGFAFNGLYSIGCSTIVSNGGFTTIEDGQ